MPHFDRDVGITDRYYQKKVYIERNEKQAISCIVSKAYSPTKCNVHNTNI